MKKILAVATVVLSIPLLFVAVAFMIAAMVKPERLLVAGVLLVMGGALLAWGIATLRRLAQRSPQALATGVVTLARKTGGELTVEQVQAEFGLSLPQASEVLEGLAARGQAQTETRDGRVIYVFPSLRPARVSRRCPYCGSEFPVRDAVTKCPHCGGPLAVVKS